MLASRSSPRRRLAALLVLVACAGVAMPSAAQHGSLERVTTGMGPDAIGGGAAPALTPDGRFLAFVSAAADLVEGDANGVADVFVQDRADGAIEIVSLSTEGAQGDRRSGYGDDLAVIGPVAPRITPDGRFVAFASDATTLVAGDTNLVLDAFVRDRETGTTERVSLTSDGVEAHAASYPTAISDDGRFVLFTSYAENLLPPDAPSCTVVVPCTRIFLRDRLEGTTTLVSANAVGEPADQSSGGGDLSADGRSAVFHSIATNLGVPLGAHPAVFVKDLETGTVEWVSAVPDGVALDAGAHSASISDDGRFVAFASGLDHGDGAQAGCAEPPPPSAGVSCHAIYLRDLAEDETTLVSVGEDGARLADDAGGPVIGPDGRFVAFHSRGAHPDRFREVFVHDRESGASVLVSLTASGRRASQSSMDASIAADGRYVAFASAADDLVPGDANGDVDVFLRDAVTCPPDASEDGPASSAVHEQVEQLAPSWETWAVLHDGGCVLAGAGL